MNGFLRNGFTVVAVLLAAGCGAPRQSEPLTGPLTRTDAQVARGQRLFAENCNKCHDGGRTGLAPALLPAPASVIRFQVRHGLGVMPAFDKDRLSDSQLDDLMAYLNAIRR
jgi:mono/diheme cytochrome c family protein